MRLLQIVFVMLLCVFITASVQTPVLANVDKPVSGGQQVAADGDNWVIADFESEALGLMGWSKQWGAALKSVFWYADDSGLSTGALTCEVDASLEVKGAFGKDGLDIFWTATQEGATAITFDVFVPGDLPDGTQIKVWAQDRVNWSWVDYKYIVGDAGELGVVPGDWVTVTFPLKEVIESNAAFVPTSGIKTGIEFYFNAGETWSGYIQVDNITLLGVAPPQAELVSPTNVAAAPDSSELVFGNKLFWNHISWTDFPENVGETYNVYVSTSPITDVAAAGVIKLDSDIPRGVRYFNHEPHTTNGHVESFYYAVTTTGLDEGALIETPVVPGSGNCGPVATKSSIPVIVPLVETFNFVADGNLGEFQAFPDIVIQTDRAGGPAAVAWDEASTDCNFTGYLVMDNDNFYIGMNVIDDEPDFGSYAWEGDGIDVFAGFYDVSKLAALHGLNTMYTANHADYRFSFAINAEEGSQFQQNGSSAWNLDGLDMAIVKSANGYVVEARIPFASVRPSELDTFVPREGMFFPLKIDINDNDGEEDPYYSGSVRTMTLHRGGTDNDQNWMRPSTWGWAHIGMLTAVEQHESQLPAKMALLQNYPNPFNPSTTISYNLAKNSAVRVDVYDILGQRLATLVNEKQNAGSYSLVWNGTNDKGAQVSAGVYFVKFSAENYEQTLKMILVK